MTENRLTSFTHNCEDILLLRALADVECGFYIDVGAYDPVMDSVTKVFYDRGWRGLNLEPNPAYLDRLRRQRPRDSNVGVAVSDRADGKVEFHVIEDTGLSTLDANQASLSSAGRPAFHTICVETQTLATLWNIWVPPGQQVHFLKIDVEGAEEQVILGADWKQHRPWILVIEATVPNSSIASHFRWEPIILQADYLFAYFDGVNRYYIAEEKSELLAVFDRPANPMTDHFKPFLAELIERNLRTEIDALQGRLSVSSEHVQTLEGDLSGVRQANVTLQAQNDDLWRMCQRLDDGKQQADELRQRIGQIGEEMGGLRQEVGERLAELRQHMGEPRQQADELRQRIGQIGEEMGGLRQQLRERLDELRQQIGEQRQQLENFGKTKTKTKPSALWEKIVFHGNWRPRRFFRRALFHAKGKPRDMFRGLILKKDGTPHRRFRAWMMSPDYQRQRAAIRFELPGSPATLVAMAPAPAMESELSPRTRDLLESLESRLTTGT